MDRIDLTLVQGFTAAALAGIASRERSRHGADPRTADDIAFEAVALGKATAAAFEVLAAEQRGPRPEDDEPAKPRKR